MCLENWNNEFRGIRFYWCFRMLFIWAVCLFFSWFFYRFSAQNLFLFLTEATLIFNIFLVSLVFQVSLWLGNLYRFFPERSTNLYFLSCSDVLSCCRAWHSVSSSVRTGVYGLWDWRGLEIILDLLVVHAAVLDMFLKFSRSYFSCL